MEVLNDKIWLGEFKGKFWVEEVWKILSSKNLKRKF
jgi:hypothetical protein